LAGDLEIVHDYRTPQGRFDFSDLNAQSFLSRGACNPQAQSVRDQEWRQADAKNGRDKQRAAKNED
jgi:hypothetical protein